MTYVRSGPIAWLMGRDELFNGWYGLIAIGDGWKPVTPSEQSHTLSRPEAIKAGATHAGYWDGRDWQHVEVVEDIVPPGRR